MDNSSSPIAFHATQDPISGLVAPRLGANASIGVYGVRGDGLARALTAEGHDASEDGTGRGTPIVASFAENQRGEVRETDVALSLSASGGKPGQGYPAARVGSAVRRLTPTECERLMGWPDGWTILEDSDEPNPLPDAPRYAACGDGVVAPVAEWIGRRLAPYVDGRAA